MRAHELVAAVPVDFTTHDRTESRELAIDRVPDGVAFLADVGDARAREDAFVVRLPTTSRVERGAVESDAARLTVDLRHGGVELAQIGVAQVEQLGHALASRQSDARVPMSLASGTL
jgi:hypothetical protein